MSITHTTVKVDGKANEYDIKFGGAVIGRATRGKFTVKVEGKDKSVEGFMFKPGAEFAKVGDANAATMKDLKTALEAAVAKAGIEAPKKADPLPAADAKTTEAKPADAALAGDTAGDIDL